MERQVMIGAVNVFHPIADKAQAKKILEEAAEVFGAWQYFDENINDEYLTEWTRKALINECADLIQALANFLAGLDVTDMRDAMRECWERNKARGRTEPIRGEIKFTDGESVQLAYSRTLEGGQLREVAYVEIDGVKYAPIGGD